MRPIAPFLGSVAVAQTINRDLRSYVLFALYELDFKGGNGTFDRGHVLGGNVGTNQDSNLGDTQASVNGGANGLFRMDDFTQLVGGSIRLGPESSVYDVYVDRQMGSGWGQPTTPCGGPTVRHTVYTISNAVDLPIIPYSQLTPENLCGSFDPVGTVDITVTTLNSPYTLSPGAYRDVEVQNACVLYLQSGVYTLRRFMTGQTVNVYTVPGTVMHIWGDGDPNQVDFSLGGNGSYFGAYAHDGSSVTCICISDVYANNHVQFSDNGEFWGVIIAPNATINLGRNFTHYGRFVGRTIGSDFNDNVFWRDCTEGPAMGACCFADGRCIVVTQAECAAQGGTWQGERSIGRISGPPPSGGGLPLGCRSDRSPWLWPGCAMRSKSLSRGWVRESRPERHPSSGGATGSAVPDRSGVGIRTQDPYGVVRSEARIRSYTSRERRGGDRPRKDSPRETHRSGSAPCAARPVLPRGEGAR